MEKAKQNIPAPPQPRRRRGWLIALGVVLALLLVAAGVLYSQRTAVHSLVTGSHYVAGTAGETALKLPPGFHADIFYPRLNSPRFITFSPDGTLFVAERGANSIIALPDPQHT